MTTFNRNARTGPGIESAGEHETVAEQEEEMTVEQYLAIRKQAALQIDPETAEFSWGWGQILDPYGVHPDLPEEYDCFGRVYFARSPGSDVWVSFYDLQKATVERLWQRIRKGVLCERDWFDIPFKEDV